MSLHLAPPGVGSSFSTQKGKEGSGTEEQISLSQYNIQHRYRQAEFDAPLGRLIFYTMAVLPTWLAFGLGEEHYCWHPLPDGEGCPAHLLSVNSPLCLHVCVQGVPFFVGSGCLKFGAWYYCLGYNAF